MGFSVQLFETLAWAEELLERRDRGRRAPAAPASTPAPATRASRDGPRPPARTRTAPPSWSAIQRYEPCASRDTPRSSRRWAQVYCGDLDRYVELTGEVARRYGTRARRYGLAVLRRRAPVRAAGSRRRSR